MAGRTPQEAVRNFLRPLQKSLQCVVRTAVLKHRGDYELGQEYTVALSDGAPQNLRGGSELALTVIHRYRIVEVPGDALRGPYKISTAAYIYELYDHQGRRVLGYHWHPIGHTVTYPHVHVGALRVKAHLPTGRISLEEVLRLAIGELGVRPQRSDWERTLREGQDRFTAWRTWPGTQG